MMDEGDPAAWPTTRPAAQDPTEAPDEDDFLNLPPEGQHCLQEFWNSLPLDGVHCNASWDTFYCWPATPAGDTVRRQCGTIFKDLPALDLYPHAMWGSAGSQGVVEAVRFITFIGALLSLLTLTITVFIFTYFRTLECDRLRVHRNLVAALIIMFLVMLVLTEPFVSRRSSYTYRDVDWLCKMLLAIRMYAQMASISWMFVEGLFLHSRLTSNVFDSGAPFPIYYTIGWGCPLVFLGAWAAVMTLHYPVHCWTGYGGLPFVWILVAPMVTALLINLMFLVNIIRILVTKLRASDAVETTQVRKAIKATVVLFPLLGITNLLFAVNPGDRGRLEGAYMLTNAILQSSQGVFVSVLYCFMNTEVQELLRKRWRQYRMRRLGFPATHHHRRKSTKSTIVLENSCSLRLSPQRTPSHPRLHIHGFETSAV
ncbi:corticotropin-releasing factor receptor 1-like [Eriocheir sinensis]|uniref:corticotropin-releasing factor receptor 1-like n=1 Tax=Eriocheir sinensis TaxID=95602 RepID=UPI0021C92E25|nr:corticotropin-releasing factor receptor 1-like [Eriocheir sinensis]